MKLGQVKFDVLILTANADSVRRDAAGIPVAFRILKPGAQALTLNGQTIQGEITAADITSIRDYFAAKGEAIPVDCEHLLKVLADVRGMDEAALVKAEPLLGEKAAAGFVTLVDENGELWAHVQKWSARAKELLGSMADKMYAYFSPVIRGLKAGPLRITSIALTNTPALNSLDSLAASGEIALGNFLVQKPQEKNMDAMKKLLALLGLDAAAFAGEKADLTPLFNKAAEQIETLKSATTTFLANVKDALKLTDGQGLKDAAGLIVSLAAKSAGDATALSTLQTKVEGLEKKEFGRKVEELKAAGKLTEAMQGSAWFKGLDYAALCAWSEAAPVVVQTQRIVKPGDTTVTSGDALVMTAEVSEIAKTCGVDPKKVAEQHGLKAAA